MNWLLSTKRMVFALFCTFALIQPLEAAGKVSSFDLFGFRAEWITKSRVIAAEKVQEALAKRGIKLTAPAGRAALLANVEGAQYLIELGNSETEGFWFTLSDSAADIKQMREQMKGQPSLLTEKKITKKEFEPISQAFPALQLGSTSPETLVAFLGKANYTGADPNDEAKEGLKQWIWILKRDTKKEKDCYDAVAKKPPFQAQQVIFTFDAKNKLRKVAFVDWISGEC